MTVIFSFSIHSGKLPWIWPSSWPSLAFWNNLWNSWDAITITTTTWLRGTISILPVFLWLLIQKREKWYHETTFLPPFLFFTLTYWSALYKYIVASTTRLRKDCQRTCCKERYFANRVSEYRRLTELKSTALLIVIKTDAVYSYFIFSGVVAQLSLHGKKV